MDKGKYYIVIIFLMGLSLSPKLFGQSGYFEIDTTFSKVVQVRPTEHLLGVRYGYEITGVSFAPDLKAKSVHSPLNFSILYTYYHNLWDTWSYFGIQTGAKYCKYGYTSEYNIDNMDATFTAIEVPLVSQFKYDIGERFRVLLDLGCFGGYRIGTSIPTGFDNFDARWDYGFLGGGGFALRFHPFEIHIEALYQYSLSWLYKPEKLSDEWWLYSYPHRLGFNATLYFNFR